MNLTLEQIAEDLGSPLVGGGGDVCATGCSIDTRTIRPGQVFFAIRGPRFDGHEFVASARARGAVAAVVSRDWEVSEPDLPVIRVESTTAALGTLAREIRKRWGRTVIGVTGSVGKTTTKEMIAALLGVRYRVHWSRGNLNNELGLPLSLTAVEDDHDLMVLEMGMSHSGEIRRLAEIALPNEGVVTNVNPVHLEFFDSIEGIAEAKAELIQGLVGDKRAYLNADDRRVRAMSAGFDGDLVTWGRSEGAGFRITSVVDNGLDGSSFVIRHDGEDAEFRCSLPGFHNVSNAAAAIAVAATHGADRGLMQAAVAAFSPSGLRGVVRRYAEGFAIIDDSYNSNPAALTSMIGLVGAMPGFGRRLLVAGEMLELGETGPRLHEECGRRAVEAGFDVIIGVRGDARALLEGARKEGAVPDSLCFTDTAEEAGDILKGLVRKGDLVLIKGSRGVGLEKVSEVLDRSFPRGES